MNALRRIEPKTVEMKFLDPVASVGDEKFANRSAIFSVEIDRVAPFVFALAIDVIVGINAEDNFRRGRSGCKRRRESRRAYRVRTVDKARRSSGIP